MPRTKEQFSTMRDRSRERILSAALTLFSTRGFADTSVKQIATEAGISAGLLYNYYKSKEAVMEAILEATQQDGDQVLQNMVDVTRPQESLKNLLNAVVESVIRHPAYWRFQLNITARQEVDEEHNLPVQRLRNALGPVQLLFESMGHQQAQTDAYRLLTSLEGMLLYFVLGLLTEERLAELRDDLYQRMTEM